MFKEFLKNLKTIGSRIGKDYKIACVPPCSEYQGKNIVHLIN